MVTLSTPETAGSSERRGKNQQEAHDGNPVVTEALSEQHLLWASVSSSPNPIVMRTRLSLTHCFRKFLDLSKDRSPQPMLSK